MNLFYKIILRPQTWLLCLMVVFASKALADQPVTLDFSKSTNLKMVYDAGLRPWRTTNAGCRIEASSLIIVFPQASRFSLDVSFADFDVYTDYQFSTTDFVSKRLSVDDAASKVKEIAQALGIDTTGLVEFAEQEKKSPGSSKLGYWNGRTNRGTMYISLTMETFPQMVGVNANIQLGLNWETGGIPPKMFTKPMTPPPGYENVSMAPPPHDPNTKTYPPPLDWPKRPVQAHAKPPQGTPNPISAPSPTTEPAAPASHPWPWLLLAFIVAALAVVFRFLRRK